MALARAYKRGTHKGKVSDDVKRIAESMSDEDLTDFMHKEAEEGLFTLKGGKIVPKGSEYLPDPEVTGKVKPEDVMRDPGVYLMSRRLRRGPIGTHNFVTIIPKDPEQYKGYPLVDLGGGTMGIITSADGSVMDQNGVPRLYPQFNDPVDVQAAQTYFRDMTREGTWKPTIQHLGGDDEKALSILKDTMQYGARPDERLKPYPAMGLGQNSNTFANSLLRRHGFEPKPTRFWAVKQKETLRPDWFQPEMTEPQLPPKGPEPVAEDTVIKKEASVNATIQKMAAVLKAKNRAHISQKNFAIPGRAETADEKKKSGNYPIHDIEHARAALRLVGMHGSDEEKAQVRAKVHAKYPSLGKTASEFVGGMQKIAAIAEEGFSDEDDRAILHGAAGVIKKLAEECRKRKYLRTREDAVKRMKGKIIKTAGLGKVAAEVTSRLKAAKDPELEEIRMIVKNASERIDAAIEGMLR